MSRRDYQAYLAEKRRRGSVIESETDRSSLYSHSTQLSTSSRLSSTSPILHHPTPRYLLPRDRAFSSSSSTYSAGPSLLEVPQRSDEQRRKDREERRRKRRAERERKSTLKGEEWASPLRGLVRSLGAIGLGKAGMVLACGSVAVALRRAGRWRDWAGRLTPDERNEAAGHLAILRSLLSASPSELPAVANERQSRLAEYLLYGLGKGAMTFAPSGLADAASFGRLLHAASLLLEMLCLWSGVVAWCMSEGKRGRRSWRTQMTGIATILLQPLLLLFDRLADPFLPAVAGLLLHTLTFLGGGNDVFACGTFALAASIELRSAVIAPALISYLLGKSLWLSGQIRMSYLVKLVPVSCLSAALITLSWFGPFDSKLSSPDKLVGTPDLFRSDIIGMILSVLTLVPFTSLVVYLSVSLRPTSASPLGTPSAPLIHEPTSNHAADSPPNETTPPIARFLPTTFVLSALGFYLFSPGTASQEVIFPMVGVWAMMALRGPDDVQAWEVGMLLSNVSVLLGQHRFLRWESLGTILLFNWLVGYRPWSVKTPWLRLMSLIIYATIAVLHVAGAVRSPRASVMTAVNIASDGLLWGVWAFMWFWGMKRLVEGAWAIGGFDGDAERIQKKVNGEVPRSKVE